jgi:hypothetical protein
MSKKAKTIPKNGRIFQIKEEVIFNVLNNNYSH